MLRCACLLALVFALPRAASAQTIWTVASDGSGTFTQIQPAIDVAADGDVIVVKSGNYAPFDASKRLTIVGPEFASLSAPTVQITGINTVHDTTGFTLAGLSMQRLVLRDVTGPVTIDECWVIQTGLTAGNPSVDALRVSGLVLSRSRVNGGLGNYGISPIPAAGWGLRVDSSLFTIDSSIVIGGTGNSTGSCSNESAGGPGVQSTASTGTIVNSTLEGGDGGVFCCLCACCFTESGGIPLRASGGQVLFLGPISLVKPPSNQPLGGLVYAVGTKLVWATNNPPTNVQLSGGATLMTAPSGIWLSVTGSDTPGQTRSVRVAAPLGAPGILALGQPNQPSPLFGFSPDLWLNPGGSLFLWPIVGTGASSPVLDLVLPSSPSVVGTQLLAQAAFPGVTSSLDPASASLSNPAPILLRY